MRILLTFAVEAEFAPWRSRHPFVPYEFDDGGKRRDFDLYRANINSNEVTVLLTGMGGENASNAMRTIHLELTDVCIATGLAGALDPSLKPGTMVAGKRCEALSQDLKAASDRDLVDFALAAGARAMDLFLTSEAILATAKEKQSLSTSWSVVDMESAHVLAAASRLKVPVVAIRAISDAADEDLPVDFQQILDSRGRVRVRRLLKELAWHPHRLPLLVRFGRQSRAAAWSLADFLDRYIPLIEAKWHGVCTRGIEEVSAT
jgi:adenosylhomocysteine nucleosidase